jgi:hypothetical protein
MIVVVFGRSYVRKLLSSSSSPLLYPTTTSVTWLCVLHICLSLQIQNINHFLHGSYDCVLHDPSIPIEFPIKDISLVNLRPFGTFVCLHITTCIELMQSCNTNAGPALAYPHNPLFPLFLGLPLPFLSFCCCRCLLLGKHVIILLTPCSIATCHVQSLQTMNMGCCKVFPTRCSFLGPSQTVLA